MLSMSLKYIFFEISLYQLIILCFRIIVCYLNFSVFHLSIHSHPLIPRTKLPDVLLFHLPFRFSHQLKTYFDSKTWNRPEILPFPRLHQLPLFRKLIFSWMVQDSPYSIWHNDRVKCDALHILLFDCPSQLTFQNFIFFLNLFYFHGIPYSFRQCPQSFNISLIDSLMA